MEGNDSGSTDPRVVGGVKLAVDVPPNAREALKRSPKTLPKPRERARSFAAGLGSQATEAKEKLRGIVNQSTVSKQSDANQWKSKALDFHDLVVQEVERLLHTVEDKEAADKANDTLKRARVSPGARSKMNPERFIKQAEQVVTLLQRIQLQHPAVLQPPPM